MYLELVTNFKEPLLGRRFGRGLENELWAAYIPQALKLTPLLTEQLVTLTNAKNMEKK